MKTKLLTLIAILFTLTTFAQNDLKARIAYEDAETAFANEDYATAVTHLTEAEKLLGKWTPKIGYLLITSLYKTLDYKNPDTTQLGTLEKQINHYMQYADKNQGIDMDKFREINTIENDLKNFMNLRVQEDDTDYILGSEFLKKRDYENAMIYLKRAAANNNSYAMYSIGYAHFLGLGVSKSNLEAMNWFKKSANIGYIASMTWVGDLYQLKDFNQNYSEAMIWYKKAADKGSPRSMTNIGFLYYEGKGAPQSYVEAIKWWKKAADKGDTTAMNSIGLLYHNGGNGIIRNEEEALKWYQKAANNGNVKAMNNIGKLYHGGGNGIVKNYGEAIKWYEKALKLGYTPTNDDVSEVGSSYYSTQNYSKAMEWYTKAFEIGDSKQKNDAKYYIAKMYEEGLGVEKNKKLAKEWRNK